MEPSPDPDAGRALITDASENGGELLRLFEAVEDYAVFTMSVEGIVEDWHPCSRRLLGYESAEILGKCFSCFYPPSTMGNDNVPTKLREAASRERLDEEGWRIRKDGTRFWASAIVSAVRDDQGQVRAFGVVIRDLTERRRAATLFQSVIDNADDCIVTINSKGEILLFNDAAERTFGYEEWELVGENVRILMPEPYRANHDRYLADYVQTGMARVLGIGRELVGRRKDGSVFPLHLEVSEFWLDEQRHFIGIVRDLTESKKIEERLRESQKLEAIGQLAGGVAHDFNNLITVISGYSEILHAMFEAEDPRLRMVGEIREAGRRAAALTRQLLAFSRKQILEPRIIDVNNIVAGMEGLLQRLIGEDIRLNSSLNPTLWTVKVDPSQLEHVVINLAVNARDAMPLGGQLTIETRNVELRGLNCPPECRPGEYVLLAVSDTGCGMTPEVKARLFEPFFSTKDPGKGTGLGLATAYGVIKQSEGHISVYSEPGEGTTFKVYLPKCEGLPSTPAPVRDEPAMPCGTETILLAEDEQALRAMAEGILRRCGYTVLTAADGLEAIDLAENYSGRIDLLLSDVVMPYCGGRVVAEQVTAYQPGIRVLYASGYTDDAVIRHGIVDSERAFLQKPYTPYRLALKVREVLDSAD